MWTLKYYFRSLHTLIKPAADAHTLTIPAPLIGLACQQLQNVEGMKDSSVVILLTPELMYFQRMHTDIRDQARFVESFIPGASFPRKLGFIVLPYSQGPSFFTNLAIYHEIGHFVYEELSNLTTPHPDIAALRSAMAGSLNNAFGRGSRNRQAVALGAKIIENWTQEIFCDLFAIRLVGPAFSFALVEILGMLGFLERSATVRFNPTHPASAYRFSQHVAMLRDDTWWDAIADVRPEQKELLEKLAKIPRSSYRFYLDDRTRGRDSLMDAFLDSVVPAILKLVRQVTAATEPKQAVKRFKQNRSSITDCLWAGVVPHIANSGPPDPVSIINSAFCFYLKSLPDLIRKFEGPEGKNNVQKYSLWTARLEMWTMKAVEDSEIQDQFRRKRRYDPS